MFKFTNKRVVLVATIAALYVIFTVLLAPISYGPIQFRVSEALKVFVLFDPFLALGIGLGTFLANMASPFAGPWDLIWMPLTDMAGGLLAYLVYVILGKRIKLSFIPMILYAVTTGFSVGLMLQAFGLGNFLPLSYGVIASELIILLGGLPVMLGIYHVLNLRGFSLVE